MLRLAITAETGLLIAVPSVCSLIDVFSMQSKRREFTMDRLNEIINIHLEKTEGRVGNWQSKLVK